MADIESRGASSSSANPGAQQLLASSAATRRVSETNSTGGTAAANSASPTLAEPRRMVAQRLTGTLLGQEEPLDYERIRREASAPDNRQQFEVNQREAMREAFQRRIERSPGAFVLLLLCAISVPIFLLVLYIYGWVTYFKHGGEPCDWPLATWLLIKLCQQPVSVIVQKLAKTLSSQTVISERCEQQVKVVLQNAPILIDVVGFCWFMWCKTCPETNPALYNFVKLYIIVNIVITVVFGLLLVVLVSLVFYGVANGWFDNSDAADAGVLEALETVTFDPELFATEGVEDDPRPAGDCCCCTEAFGHDKEIKRTPCSPCQHYFHKECLEQWLKRARTCPLCRSDLQEAVKEQQVEDVKEQHIASEDSPV